MKKVLLGLLFLGLFIFILWACNSGQGGDPTECDMTQYLPQDELEASVLDINSPQFGINGKCEVSRTSDGGFKVVVLPSTDTRTPIASGTVAVACN